jgi:hypothetical protein
MFPRLRWLNVLLALPALVVVASVADAADREFSPVQDGFVRSGQLVPEYAPGRVLVKLTPAAARIATQATSMTPGVDSPAATGIESLDRELRASGLNRMTRPYQPRDLDGIARGNGIDRQFVFEGDPAIDAMELARRLEADPNVEAATVDWRVFPAVAPNDPMYPSQWGHNNSAQMLSYDWATHSHENGSPVGTVAFDANAEAAWDVGFGDTGVIIAILDSGVSTIRTCASSRAMTGATTMPTPTTTPCRPDTARPALAWPRRSRAMRWAFRASPAVAA